MESVLVKDLIAEMVAWYQNGYLDPRVWEQIGSKINPAALPDNVSTLQLPAPPIGPYQSQVALMVR